ncbi:MAG: N-acetyl-gamma-glutamyl-phosphate reductase [Clostridiales bacterium]|jgi:N-acetyl-gamma-glutamyl-phosphate reductase|nr:N-acetyl-gamma-glutamyl-phosphate reductase [Clostridiales bacterium]
MIRVFIDGQAGTTGLKLQGMLADRGDVKIHILDEAIRKDAAARRAAIEGSDIVFVCLPDEGARETARLAEGTSARVIDASTAHRCLSGWAYGFPELSASHRAAVEGGARVSVPGCHASGFIALTYPLLRAGLLSAEDRLSCFSLTGYSGGGKSMIAAYENPDRDWAFRAPRIYGLSQTHKHLPEMQGVTGLRYAPIFTPVIADVYSGMAVTVPLFGEGIPGGIKAVRECLAAHYEGARLVRVNPLNEGLGADADILAMAAMKGRNDMVLAVSGNDKRITLTALYDNLGKGAAGAAVQCFNLMTGRDETTGLL